MTQLAWRQFRAQALVTYGLLAVIAVVLAITGPRLAHYYDAYVTTCRAHGDCDAVTATFLSYWHAVQAALGPILLVLPALVGIFWGAPLIARELETGTFRLAWTQSLTRQRWLAVKLGLAGLAAITAAGLLSLMVTWWFSPLDRVNLNLLSPGMFGERGIVPVGYAAFALALGVTAGLLIRRTVPAMAVTLAGYAGARLGMTYGIRPHLFTPLRITSALQLGGPHGPPPGPGAPSPADWVLSSTTINAAGRVIGQNGGISSGPGTVIGFQASPSGVTLTGVGRCPNIPPGASLGDGSAAQLRAFQACIDKLGVRQELVYQPVSRYWDFQWCELAIFLAAAVLLAGFCFWWLRRRLA